MDLRMDDDMCPGALHCGARFSDSPCAAIITFHERKHSFDAAQPWTVRSNGKQRYPDRIGKARARREIVHWRIVLYKRIRPGVRECVSRMTRRGGWCSCMSLLQQRNGDLEMSPLQLE